MLWFGNIAGKDSLLRCIKWSLCFRIEPALSRLQLVLHQQLSLSIRGSPYPLGTGSAIPQLPRPMRLDPSPRGICLCHATARIVTSTERLYRTA
jgi:hypothetical protein